MAHPASSTHLFLIRSYYYILLFVCLFVFPHQVIIIDFLSCIWISCGLPYSTHSGSLLQLQCIAMQLIKSHTKKQKQNIQTDSQMQIFLQHPQSHFLRHPRCTCFSSSQWGPFITSCRSLFKFHTDLFTFYASNIQLLPISTPRFKLEFKLQINLGILGSHQIP